MSLAQFFKTRDELSFRNVRGSLWAGVAVFPFAVIMGNLRYFDHSVALAAFRTNELTFFLLGLGWLILAAAPRKFVAPCLRVAAAASAVILPFLILMPMGGYTRFALYLAFKFFNGLCAAGAFFVFCFALNNVERLLGMAAIQVYYAFYYASWDRPAVFRALESNWGGAVLSAAFIAVAFLCTGKGASSVGDIDTDSGGKGSGVPFVVGLGAVHYMIVCMGNYIEWAEASVSAFAFGMGIFASVALIFAVQLLKGRSALYIWLLSLALTLLGLGALLFETHLTIISGSFAWGMGDSMGYVIIGYMCASAIKRSRSHRMFRLYCLVAFVEYFAISGLFSHYFERFDGPNRLLAFGIVLVLVSLCLVFMPLIQKRLFDADWTDGLYLRDMEEYARPLAETEALAALDGMNLTPREGEVFTMLLAGKSPKEIAYLLKIRYGTVLFHQNNLYRKLGIQSRTELYRRYPKGAWHQNP